ncbi:helix-turn-helix transcriptional regulator [Enterococcus malodoratus]|nr:AraC family transcriptional regulator [Enterococcus malodoratus]
MDNLENMKRAIDYIEENLVGEIEYPKIAQIALCSQYHFKRMFVFLIGIPLSEYIRRRRLTMAALDLQNTDDKVIDIAVKYGYSSADAFSRAFQGMHAVTPSQARKKDVRLKVQPRVSFALSLKGVIEMNYRIVEKKSFFDCWYKGTVFLCRGSRRKCWENVEQCFREIDGEAAAFS